MKNSISSSLVAVLIALAGCASPQPTLQSTTKFITAPSHSAVPTGTYATPTNLKGTTIGSVNTKDMKSNWEMIALDGNLWELRNNLYPATNEFNFVMNRGLNGTLEINPKTKQQEILPSEYSIPTQWMISGTTNPVREVTLDARVLKANVSELEKFVNGGDGVLKASAGLVDFGLNTRNINGNEYLFLKRGTNNTSATNYLVMPVNGLKIKVYLQTGTLTLRNQTYGAYLPTTYSSNDFYDLMDQRRQARLPKPGNTTRTNTTPTAPVFPITGISP